MSWEKYSWIIGVLLILFSIGFFFGSGCQTLIGPMGPSQYKCAWFGFLLDYPLSKILAYFIMFIPLIFGILILIWNIYSLKKKK